MTVGLGCAQLILTVERNGVDDRWLGVCAAYLNR